MVSNEPKITVLMAVYNGEKTISRAIDSILNQTFSDFEFLIINDCSTDKTVDIINSYNDKRIILHNNKTNLGQTKSLNLGLNLCNLEYIARMDADDYSLPERLEKQYIFMKNNSEYAVVGTECLVVDEFNNKKCIRKGSSKYEDIVIKMLYLSPINHVSVLMKTSIIKEVGGYNPEFIIAADFDLWSRLVRIGHKITTLQEILTIYTDSESSYSYRNIIQRNEELVKIVYENIISFSDYQADEENVRNMLKMFYDGFINMTDEDLMKGQQFFENVIKSIKPELVSRVQKKFIKKILLQGYYSSAYHLILDKKHKKARQIIEKCILNNGLSFQSLMVYILTYFNANTVRMANYFRTKYLQSYK